MQNTGFQNIGSSMWIRNASKSTNNRKGKNTSKKKSEHRIKQSSPKHSRK